MVRQPAVKGMFYEADEKKLRLEIESCFISKFGPGDLPGKRGSERIIGVLVPHAGYTYSGPCAAWAYKVIAETRLPEAYIILGTDHRGKGSAISIDSWETPLGQILSNKELAEKISKGTGIRIDESTHKSEHSIEVQLPFLKYISKEHEARIVAISVGGYIDLAAIGKKLHDALLGHEVVFIISSDFTHYGFNYGYVPFVDDIPNKLRKLDQGAIDAICKLDADALARYIQKTGITMCGYLPTILFLNMINAGEKKPDVRLLKHYLSGDIAGDYRNSVSYASLIFK